jgi:hypothetical protein
MIGVIDERKTMCYLKKRLITWKFAGVKIAEMLLLVDQSTGSSTKG